MKIRQRISAFRNKGKPARIRSRLALERLEPRLQLCCDTISDASFIPLGPDSEEFVSEEIDPGEDDRDIFEVELSAGDTLTVDIHAESIGSSLDSYVRIFDFDGFELTSNNDGDGLDSFLEFVATQDARYFIGVSSFDNTTYDPFDPFDGAGNTVGFYEMHLIRESAPPPQPLLPGDANQDIQINAGDLVQIIQAGKYLTGQPAPWGEGDFNGGPGGSVGNPPAGNGQFDQFDLQAMIIQEVYELGSYQGSLGRTLGSPVSISPGGILGDGQTSLSYDASTGELGVDAPAMSDITSINIASSSSVFTGSPAQGLGGSFDMDTDSTIFKSNFSGSFTSLSLGNVAAPGLSESFLLTDLTVSATLVGGTTAAAVDLVYVAADAPPTLDPISNPNPLPEDAAQQVVEITGISAGGGQSQPLAITASSNNPGLIPDPSVSYTSPDSTGSLSYTPVANQSGTTVITVTVTDGGLDGNLATASDNEIFERTFTVTVTPVNDIPNLDSIPDPVAITEDANRQTVNLSGINAGGGESQPLAISATSSNPGLIPNPSVNYIAPGSRGSVSYVPVAQQSGSTTITVTVTDGGLDGNLSTGSDNSSFERSFTVTVTPINDTPTLEAIPSPPTVNENAGQQVIELRGITAGTGESQPLAVSATSDNPGLIPQPSVAYASPDSTGSLSYEPAFNQGGTARITVTVTDGGLDESLATSDDNGTFSRTFTVSVRLLNDAPTLDPIPSPSAIDEDSAQQAINLQGISAGGGEDQLLAVTAASDNPALIPNPTVVYASPDSTGTLSYAPSANQSGNARITVSVTDSGFDGSLSTDDDNRTFTRAFNVSVSPVNDAPTLAEIPNPAAIDENAGLQTVSLAGIMAGGGEDQPLAIAATSDNPSLIPHPAVDYISPNTTGSLSYASVANQSGSAQITVVVTDGGLDGNLATGTDNGLFSRSFNVTVNNTIPDGLPLEFAAIDPNPRAGSLEAVTIRFTSMVTGFDLRDLRLTRQGVEEEVLSLDNAELSSANNQEWTLGNLASLTSRAGTYRLSFVPNGVLDELGNPIDNSIQLTWANGPGDVNFDGIFDQFDLLDVHDSGKFMTGLAATWSEGDWNEDGVFDQRDLMLVLDLGHYRKIRFASQARTQD